jgi:hypothetical protein
MTKTVFEYDGNIFYEKMSAQRAADLRLSKMLHETVQYVWNTHPAVSLDLHGILWRGDFCHAGMYFISVVIEKTVS